MTTKQRIEQAIARRKLTISGRGFHEVYGYGADAIVSAEVDTEILADECVRLADEVVRLKEGRFTEEEFQNLCHTFDGNDVCRFRKGCREYQVKLFGELAVAHDEYKNIL